MITDIVDLDSHEMIPSHYMGETFGEVGYQFAALCEDRQRRMQDFTDNSMVAAGVTDTVDITDESVWTMKGSGAPSAIDLRRRSEVLDAMGVKAELIFPTFGLGGFMIADMAEGHFQAFFGLDHELPFDRREMGKSMIRAHNEWAARGLDVDKERVRVVAIVSTESVDVMMSEARDLIGSGVRALWISAGQPPAGLSPADRRLDEFWSLAEDNDVPIVFHVGTEFGFLDDRWRMVPEFASKVVTVEVPNLDVYTLSTQYYAVENFLTTMVLGKVFERHPRLRVGVIECMATWVGPMARRLDLMVDALHANADYPMRPSEYINRNIRVTPFWFEPVDEYFRRYPDLSDVYCYSSDYPHVEGGKHTKQRFYEKLEPLGHEVLEKFFRRNGEFIVPSRVGADAR